MIKIVKNATLFVMVVITITGCAKNEIDIASYQNKIKEKVTIPDICKPQYNSAMPKVAVVDFTNNSTFGDGQINRTTSQTNSSAIIGGTKVGRSGFVGAGVGESNTVSNSENRDLKARLEQAFSGPLEDMVSNSGGAVLLSRNDMDKIDSELKLQDSGLVDPKTVVKLGKLVGAKYIITGSIDNVDLKFTDNGTVANAIGNETARSKDNATRLVGLLLQVGAAATDGMVITSKATIKIIDVETGKIEFSRTLGGSTNIGKFKNPSYDQIVGAVKKNIIDGLPALNEDFATYFSVKGYITQLRYQGKDVVAQVNVGRDFKVVENQIFKILNFDSLVDPLNGNESCDISISKVKLKATNQITPTSTWATIEDGDGMSLKLGQLIQKTHEKGSFGIFK